MVAMTQDNGLDRLRPAGRICPTPWRPSGRIAAIYTGSKYFALSPGQGQRRLHGRHDEPDRQLRGRESRCRRPSRSAGSRAPRPGRARGSPRPRSRSRVTASTSSSARPPLDQVLHVAEINASNGNVSEVATAPTQSIASQVEVSVVNNRIFVFSAEGSAGLNVYEFVPPSTLAHVATIALDARRLAVRGPAAVPGPLRPQVPGLEPVVDQHLRHQVADAGRLAAAREVAPALRRRRFVPGRRLRGLRPELRRDAHRVRLPGAPADHRRAVRSGPTRSTSPASRPTPTLRRSPSPR